MGIFNVVVLTKCNIFNTQVCFYMRFSFFIFIFVIYYDKTCNVFGKNDVLMLQTILPSADTDRAAELGTYFCACDLQNTLF